MEEAIKALGPTGAVLGVLIWVIRYFMEKLDAMAKKQDEKDTQVLALLGGNVAAMERFTAAIDGLRDELGVNHRVPTRPMRDRSASG
jgi:hypothetical protein